MPDGCNHLLSNRAIFKTEITGFEYFKHSNLHTYRKLSENNLGKQYFYYGKLTC